MSFRSKKKKIILFCIEISFMPSDFVVVVVLCCCCCCSPFVCISHLTLCVALLPAVNHSLHCLSSRISLLSTKWFQNKHICVCIYTFISLSHFILFFTLFLTFAEQIERKKEKKERESVKESK